MAFDGRVSTGKVPHILCTEADFPDVTAGKWYQIRIPSVHGGHPEYPGSADFDYFDDAGDWVWAMCEDDPACVWGEVVNLSLDVAEYLNSKAA